MADPVVWEGLPKSQDDDQTIAEAIAAAMADHNADPDAHMGDSGSVQSHRSADVLDHPDLSVQASNITIDVHGVGGKAGSIPAAGIDWSAAGTVPSGTYLAVSYGVISSIKFVAVGDAGKNINSADGDTWVAGTAIDSKDWNLLAFGNGVYVAGCAGGTDHCLAYSTDGHTWTRITTPSNAGCTNVLWDGSRFIATFYGFIFPTTYGDTLVSTDGISWSPIAGSDQPFSVPVQWTELDGGFYYYPDGTDFKYSFDFLTWSSLGTDPYIHLNTAGEIGGRIIGTATYDNDDNSPEILLPYNYEMEPAAWITTTGATFNDSLSLVTNIDTYCFFNQSVATKVRIAITANGASFYLVTVDMDGDLWDTCAGPEKMILLTNASSGTRIAWSEIPVAP